MSQSFPIIKTERLLLRQITESDLENIYQGLSNPDITRYYAVSFDSLEATKEQMDWYADLEKSNTGIWWAICSSDNSVFYGAGGYHDVSKDHKKAEIGFWLLPPHWGKGIMKEAMPLICSYGFDELQLHRIEGFVESDNTNCKKALAKVQFKHEGTMEDCEVKDGKYISLDIYAQLKSDRVV